MRRECKYHAHFTGMDTEFELKWQKSNDKELTWLFWNKFSASDFYTVVHRFFFPRPLTRLKHGWMNNNFI